MFRIYRLLGLVTLACALQAAVKLPALISDHMVLQQGMPVRIWGAADPGESVKVDFQGQSVTVKAAEVPTQLTLPSGDVAESVIV